MKRLDKNAGMRLFGKIMTRGSFVIRTVGNPASAMARPILWMGFGLVCGTVLGKYTLTKSRGGERDRGQHSVVDRKISTESVGTGPSPLDDGRGTREWVNRQINIKWADYPSPSSHFEILQTALTLSEEEAEDCLKSLLDLKKRHGEKDPLVRQAFKDPSIFDAILSPALYRLAQLNPSEALGLILPSGGSINKKDIGVLNIVVAAGLKTGKLRPAEVLENRTDQGAFHQKLTSVVSNLAGTDPDLAGAILSEFSGDEYEADRTRLVEAISIKSGSKAVEVALQLMETTPKALLCKDRSRNG